MSDEYAGMLPKTKELVRYSIDTCICVDYGEYVGPRTPCLGELMVMRQKLDAASNVLRERNKLAAC